MSNRTPVGSAKPVTAPQSGSYVPGANVGKVGSPEPSTTAGIEKTARETREAREGDANTNAPVAPVRPNLISQDKLLAMKELVANSDFFIENPLNNYLNYTYKFRLLMTQDLDFLTDVTSGDNGGDVPASKVFDAIDSRPIRVIAESGVTTGFNISDEKIESIVGPNMETLNTNATQFVINLEEPLGTSLLEVMRNAALGLQIRNLDKTYYLLELRFLGYDEEGEAAAYISDGAPTREGNEVQAVPLDHYDNGGRWVYQIAITNIETELDASGSRYTITALPYNETALDHSLGSLPKGLSLQGRTVKEFLDDMKTKLDKAWQERLLQTVFTFDFKAQRFGDADEDPNNWRIDIDTDKDSLRNSSWEVGENGVPVFQGRMGQSIASIIETMLSCTKECQDRALTAFQASEQTNDETLSEAEREERKKTKEEINKNKAKASAELFINSRLFRVEPDVDIKGYDAVDKVYRKHITFHVWPFYTQMPIVSRAQTVNAAVPEVQSQMLSELHQRGFFRKRYDYIFTGLNTEVLRLDIRYNVAWTAVLPVVRGWATGHEEHTTPAKRVDPNAPPQRPATVTLDQWNKLDDDGKKKAVEAGQQSESGTSNIYRDRDAQIDAINEEIAEKTKGKSDREAREITKTIKEERGFDQLVAERNAAYAGARKFAEWSSRLDQQQNSDIKARTGKDTQYLEDLVEAPDEALPHIVSFSYPYQQPYNNTGVGMQTPRSAFRGLYGAILEQVYGPLTSGLINIDMEIRGDPYWLAHSNVERRVHMKTSTPPPLSSSAQMANYMEGDNVFLLNFAYPFNIDEDTGDLNIRKNDAGERMDKFTGLYRVVRVTHSFSGGEFRQTLKAQRFPLLDFARAMGFDGSHQGGVLLAGQSGLAQVTNSPEVVGSSVDRAVADGTGTRGGRRAGEPRGIRNNNPGNIESNGDPWQGKVGDDGRFVVFDKPENGIRATAKTLLTYQRDHGLDTPREIIGRWAPPGENNTEAYVRSVSNAMGVSPNAKLDLNNPDTLSKLTTAIIRHENGKQPYSQAQINAGVRSALGGG